MRWQAVHSFLKIILFLLLGGSPSLCSAQILLDADVHSMPLSTLLKDWEKTHPLVFSYTQEVVADQQISIQFENLPLEEALQLVCEESGLEFERVGESYIVLRRKATEASSDQEFCGRVVDDRGEALPFANIFVPNTSRGTTTDEQGYFRWTITGSRIDSLGISYIGYPDHRIATDQLTGCPDIRMRWQAYSMPAVEVRGYLTEGIQQEMSVGYFSLSPPSIKVVPGLTEADVLYMVQLLPGINSQDESATALHIQGGTPDQNLILWDGIPVYNSGHFFGMISAFNPYITEEVRVFKGGFGAEYGGRVAGVIDIRSGTKIPERVEANLGINFTHMDAAVEIPLFNRKAALVLSARRAYTDVVESPTYKKLSNRVFQRGKIGDVQSNAQDDEALNSDLRFVFNDWNVKWHWQPDDQNRIALSYLGISDQLDFSFTDLIDEFVTNDELALNNNGLGVQWQRRWNEQHQSTLGGSFTDLRNTYQFFIKDGQSTDRERSIFQQNDIQDMSVQWDHIWKWSDWGKLSFGYRFSDLTIRRKWIFSEIDFQGEEDELDANALHTAYVNLQPDLGRKLRVNLGLRWNHAMDQQSSYWEPRLSARYLFDDHWQAKAAFGQYFQFVSQIIELNDLGLNQSLWAMADSKEDIPINRAEHYTLGISYQRKGWQIDLEGYYKDLDDLASFSSIFLDATDDVIYSIGSGEAWGIDVLLKKQWGNYQAWASYSHSRVFYSFEVFNDFEPFAAPQDYPHSLSIMQQWTHKRWDVSLSWKYGSGRAYTSAEDLEVLGDDAFPIYNYDNVNGDRLPVYHRMDASVLFRFTGRNQRMEGKLGLSVLNLYNRRNILSRQYFAFYNDEEEEFQLEILDRAMLGWTPNLLFRIALK